MRVDITPTQSVFREVIGSVDTPVSGVSKYFSNGREFSLVDVPEELRPYHLASVPEKTRRIHNALCEIRRRFREHEGTLVECVAAGSRVEFWHARQLLMTMSGRGRFLEWAQHASTPRADIYRLLDRALGQTKTKRGGWLISIPGGKGGAP